MKMKSECGKREAEFERWYDHSTWFAHNSKWIKASTKRGEEFRDFDE